MGYAFYSANRLSFGVGLKAVAATLALTTVQLGTIGTIFTLGQALIDIPAGYLADRFGRKRMLVMGMIGLGCMTAMVTTSASFIGAAFWRLAFGMAEGCWNIVMYSVAGSIFPAARAMLNGLMMTFYSIGAYVGPTYYGWSLERTGEWSIGLQNMGIVTVVFGILLIFGFKSKYTDTSKNIKRIHLMEALRTVGFNKVVWLGVLIQILNIIPYWGLASMGPYLFMTFKGFSATEVGQFFGTIYGIGGLSGVLLGFFADRFGRKPATVFLSGLNAICAVLIFHVIPQTSAVFIYSRWYYGNWASCHLCNGVYNCSGWCQFPADWPGYRHRWGFKLFLVIFLWSVDGVPDEQPGTCSGFRYNCGGF